MRWRIARNEWNVKSPPWRDAIGIEEDCDIVAVPGLICWFTRGGASLEEIEFIIKAHNEQDKRDFEAKCYWADVEGRGEVAGEIDLG